MLEVPEQSTATANKGHTGIPRCRAVVDGRKQIIVGVLLMR
jgi:hypothetical protein